MALEQPKVNESSEIVQTDKPKKNIGLYKKWQLQRIEKLCRKLQRPFNSEFYELKSRTQLTKIIHKLNKDVLLI